MIRRCFMLVSALSLSLIGGCARIPPSVPTTQSAPPAASRSLKVLYVDQDWPNALSAKQIELIQSETSNAAGADGPVWFVLVLANRRAHLEAIAYFRPEKTATRVRRVKCMRFSDWAGGQFGQRVFGPRECPPEIQITRPGQTFGTGLDVPALADAPFVEPVDGDDRRLIASDDELARLVDFARSYLDRPQRCHILQIVETEKGFRVDTGWSTGILSGSGTYLNVSRKDGAFYCPEDIHRDGHFGGVIGSWRS